MVSYRSDVVVVTTWSSFLFLYSGDEEHGTDMSGSLWRKAVTNTSKVAIKTRYRETIADNK
jgi:hypothetical protein